MDKESILKILDYITYAKRKNSGVLIIDDEKMIDTIENSLEKQIAYKPQDIDKTYNMEKIGTCKCGNNSVLEYEKYCSNCGQRLYWD